MISSKNGDKKAEAKSSSKSADQKGSDGKDKGSSDKSGKDKDKDKAKDKDKEKDKEKPKPKPKNAAELRSWEERDYIDGLLTSHGGYLKPILLSLATSLEVTPRQVAIGLGGLYFCLHLITPVFLLPHLSALVTLVIPIQATLESVKIELDEKKGAKGAKNSAQWSLFWVVYCILGIVRGWIGIWRPGWKAVFEIIRTGCLITVGGPWFGAAGLKPPGPSPELQKMEKEEAARNKANEEKKEKEKLKQEKAAKDKKEKEAKKAKAAKEAAKKK